MHDQLILAIAAVLGIVALSLGYLLWEVRRAELDAEDAAYDALRNPGMGDPYETTPIYEALCFEQQWEAER